MKKLFRHMLPMTEPETESIWDMGILTVDANFLLDMFRYQQETRDKLIKALQAFKGRLWLSHQAASEFIRNRARCVAAVYKEFDDAVDDLKTLTTATNKAQSTLRNRRALSDDVSNNLKKDVEAAIHTATASIKEAHKRYVDSASTDAMLDSILSLFDGCVGAAPNEAELAELYKESERRIKEKIPPGYEDAKKDGVNKHGDFLVWQQVLQQAKKSEKPVIFVTSEKTEDWWEKFNGTTLGVRQELLNEAHQIAGQRVLIYQTIPFLDHAAKRSGDTVPLFVRNDIRAHQDDYEFENIITIAVEELASKLVDIESEINNLIAQTNAITWCADDVIVTDIGQLDYASCSAQFTASLHYTGEQLEDRGWFGTEIQAELHGTITFKDGSGMINNDYEIEGAMICNN